jgi:hypothetical protein
MAWPNDLAGFGSLAACRGYFGVPDDLWAAFVQVVGDPKEDSRLLAALPSTVVQAAIEATVMDNGDPVSLVQAAQLGLVYRLAKRKQHVDSGLDLNLWTDPDPWATNSTSTPTPPVGDTLDQTKGTERKMKFASILDQADDSEFVVANESQKQVWLQTFVNLTGDLPMEQEDPTTEQLSALHRRLMMKQCPYVDFAVFLPFGRKAHRAQRYRTYVMTPNGFYTKELPGPSGIDQWRASFRVYRTALLMLNAVTMATAVAYESFIEKLDRLYKGCWHLVVQADELARSEHMLRLKVAAEMEIALGGKAPAMWNPENPWEALFRKLLKDSDFWAEQVHLPANAWLAHGSKGKLLTPSEAIAENNIQGGAAALKAETEAPKGNQEPWKRSANARRRDAKKRKFQEAEDKDTNTKGKGKGKGK